MSKPSHHPNLQLRAQAEAALARAPSADAPVPSPDEILHDLHVHQIELEMQNEELRRAQDELEESRDRFLDLYDFAPVGYLTLSRDGQITTINLTGAAMLGQDRSRLMQRRFAHFVAAYDEDRWHRFFVGMLRHHDRQGAEFALQSEGRGLFHARLDCLHPAGEPPMLRIALTDVTERWRTEEELRVREDRLRLAKAATGLGIHDRDLLSGEIHWDERVRELWGVGPGEPITDAMFIAGVHPDDRAAARTAFDRALDPLGSGEYHVELRVISLADGRIRQVAIGGQAFFERARAIRLIGTVKDISAQKRLERETQERRSEMELLVDKQVAAQTAAAIAHELNQPLVSISAYSEAALHMLAGGTRSPEKLVRALEGAVAQTQRAGRTLHQLLAFLHKGETRLEEVDLNGVVRDALAIAEESGYTGFRPVVKLEPALRPVLANRLQLQKVVVSLLHNGVEAMRDAGVPNATITVTVRTSTARDMAHVTVQDSGPGVDAGIADRIFEPFFTTKPNGIGLGLAISRALIEAHGGQLWADMGAGPGAMFHFSLPFAVPG